MAQAQLMPLVMGVGHLSFHLGPVYVSTAQLFSSDYRDSCFVPGMHSAQALGLALNITVHNHVSLFLILLLTQVKSQKKKKALFVPQGKRANHKVNFNVLTKQNKYQRHNLEKYQLMYNLPIVGIRLYLSSIDPFHYLFPFALLRK